MQLTSDQRARLEIEAERRGIDADELIRAAESVASGSASSPASKPSKAAKSTDAPLYMYHLPFVTVNEVRTVWLGLDPVAGGEQYAAEWAAERSPTASAKPPADE